MSQRLKLNAIKTAYSDLKSKSAFRSPIKVLKEVKKLNNSVTLKDVEKYLQGEDSYTLHKRPVLKFKTRKVITRGLKYQYQADLLELSKKHAKLNKAKYILCVIDTFSRKAFCKPLKTKTNSEVTLKFSSILNEHGVPQSLFTDEGKEFVGKGFQDFLKRKGIKHYTSKNLYHASIIERFIQTIKQVIYKYLTHNKTDIFVPKLQTFIRSYNNAPHSSLPSGMSPNEVSKHNEFSVWRHQYSSVLRKASAPSSKLKVGQLVRITKRPEVFRKGYQTRFTKEKFIITVVYPTLPPTYKIQSVSKNDDILGTFYKEELQPIQ